MPHSVQFGSEELGPMSRTPALTGPEALGSYTISRDLRYTFSGLYWNTGAQFCRLCSSSNLCSWKADAIALSKAVRSVQSSIYFHALQEASFPFLTRLSSPAQTVRKEKPFLSEA
ncbi:hypothetical protein P7K49_027718 [Saguinus oedipus]|uniref:Uncharacterized protein n=1 Tax=Saguinus oedipus TaxID=9490 RepID=A0ABQ9UAE0_SAGOE|nr:hypothetical protein P7K49_027718 [Saguinus oedipus]